MPSDACGVVVFNYPEWVTQYPKFAGVSQPVAQSYFNRVTAGGLVDNTPQSPIQDLFQRTILLNLAVCHLSVLNGDLNPAQGQVVGRVSAATQGSVSVTLDFASKGGANAAYWNQTPYGAEFYAMTLRFRTGFYTPPLPARPTLPYFGRFGRGW